MRALRFDLRTGALSDVLLPAPPSVTRVGTGTVLGAANVLGAGRATGVTEGTGQITGTASLRCLGVLPQLVTSTGTVLGTSTVQGAGVRQTVVSGVGAVTGQATVSGFEAVRPANSMESVLLLQMDSAPSGNLPNNGAYGIPAKLKSSAWVSATDGKFGPASLQLSPPANPGLNKAYHSGSVAIGDEGASNPPPVLSRLFSAQMSPISGRAFRGWTLEGWAKFETLADGGLIIWTEIGGGDNLYTSFVGAGVGIRVAPNGKFAFFAEESARGIYFAVSDRQAIIGQWFHFSIVATDALRCYVDGVNDFLYTDFPGFPAKPSLPPPYAEEILRLRGMGRFYVGRNYSGRLDAVSMTLGPRRDGNFTPPTSVPSPLPVPDAYGAETVTLLHMDGPDGSTTITDSSLIRRRMTARGSASISTAQSRFGGSSLRLYGDGGLEAVYDPRCEPLDQFTLEFWVRVSALPVSSGGHLVQFTYPNREGFFSGRPFGPILRRIDPELDPNLFTLGVTNGYHTALHHNPMSFNTWHHVAVTGGSAPRIFLDGVMSTNLPGVGGVPFGWTWTMSTEVQQPLRIGGNPSDPTGNFVGFIDELRMTQRVLYTSNFAVPTAPYPDPLPPT